MDNPTPEVRVEWRDPAAFSVIGTNDPELALKHVPADVTIWSSYHVADHDGEPCVLFLNVEREVTPLAHLAHVSIESVVSAKNGKGFCGVEIMLSDGSIAQAQMSPDEVRAMALDWLSTAEAADSDAVVVQELVHGAGVDLQNALEFLVALRERRVAAGGSDR